jgi:hypothetical protein
MLPGMEWVVGAGLSRGYRAGERGVPETDGLRRREFLDDEHFDKVLSRTRGKQQTTAVGCRQRLTPDWHISRLTYAVILPACGYPQC